MALALVPDWNLTAPAGPAGIQVMPWDEFVVWWASVFEQGQHVGVIGPTGAGKSTLEIGLCDPIRQWVMGLDPKGGDDTLAGSGWQRVTKWPLPLGIKADIKDGEPARLIIGKVANTRAQRTDNRRLLAQVVPAIWEQRNWTVIVDELQMLTDRRFFDLADDVVELLIAARNRGISVVSALQRVSVGQTTGGASSTVGDQVTWLAVAYTRDDRMVQRLAELLGRPRNECRALITSLPPHTWAIVGRDPRAPYVVTRPPKITTIARPVAPPQVSWRESLWSWNPFSRKVA